MQYLHTMIRVLDLDAALKFFLRWTRLGRNATKRCRERSIYIGLFSHKKRANLRLNSPITGTRKMPIRVAVTSVISPMRWMTFTRPAHTSELRGDHP